MYNPHTPWGHPPTRTHRKQMRLVFAYPAHPHIDSIVVIIITAYRFVRKSIFLFPISPFLCVMLLLMFRNDFDDLVPACRGGRGGSFKIGNGTFRWFRIRPVLLLLLIRSETNKFVGGGKKGPKIAVGHANGLITNIHSPKCDDADGWACFPEIFLGKWVRRYGGVMLRNGGKDNKSRDMNKIMKAK